MLLGTFIALWVDAVGKADLRHAGRAMLPLLLFFGLLVWESTVKRPADRQIMDAINEERHGARRMVLSELGLLLPVLLFGALGCLVMGDTVDLSNRISDALHAETPFAGLSTLRNWTPLLGLATAASGYIIAGAMGWTVRIVFTLLFGKEAFGSGDIHLMAATGCVAGDDR